MTEKVRACIDNLVANLTAEVARNPMARIATDEGDREAYEIVRRLERLIARKRATEPARMA